MLTIKEFAAQYSVSPSWVRRQIQQGSLSSTISGGRHTIELREAERWLSAQGHRVRVKIVSRPNQPSVVLAGDDFAVLYMCRKYYNTAYVHARRNIERRVSELRTRGFDIERHWRSGTYPYYCLRDIVEIEIEGCTYRFGPHPEAADKPDVE